RRASRGRPAGSRVAARAGGRGANGAGAPAPPRRGETRVREAGRPGAGHEMEDYRKSVLPNGIRVVTERMEQVRSVAVGIWVDTGSRNEAAERGGISHLIEHLVFKGTATRDRKSTRLNSSHLVISYAVFC